MKNADAPAFSHGSQSVPDGQKGFTKREYFAGLVMQSMCHMAEHEDPEQWSMEGIAKQAVRAADALIEELNKERKNETTSNRSPTRPIGAASEHHCAVCSDHR